MESFAKIVSAWKPLTTFAQSSIIDARQGSEYTSDIIPLFLPLTSKIRANWDSIIKKITKKSEVTQFAKEFKNTVYEKLVYLACHQRKKTPFNIPIIQWFNSLFSFAFTQLISICKLKKCRCKFHQPFSINGCHFSHVFFSC